MDRGFWTMTHRFFPMASNTWKWRLKRQWKHKKQRCLEVRPRVAIRPWRERRRHWWRWRHSKRLLRCQPLRLSLLKRTGERAISKISCKWSCIICIVKLWLTMFLKTTADAWFFMCSCFIVLSYLLAFVYKRPHIRQHHVPFIQFFSIQHRGAFWCMTLYPGCTVFIT